MEQLIETITMIQDRLEKELYPNEDAIKQGVILPILGKLGWDTSDIQSVYPEFPVENQKVDYALFIDQGDPVVLIEAKAQGKAKIGFDQLMEYVVNVYKKSGLAIPVLTDGKEWRFFWPLSRGDEQDRQVYKLDLLERPPGESAKILYRYLGNCPWRSEKVLGCIETDYEDKTNKNKAERSLPEAWENLIKDKDSILIDLLSEKVADLTGYKLESDRVLQFLSSLVRDSSEPVAPRKAIATTNRREPDRFPKNRMGFEYFGEFYESKTVKGVLISIFEELCKRDQFVEKYERFIEAGVAAGKYKVRYLAKSKNAIYPNDPGRADKDNSATRLLSNGYWLMTSDLGRKRVPRIAKEACEVAGIKYGKDLIIRL